jgi:hypothetical protein
MPEIELSKRQILDALDRLSPKGRRIRGSASR